MRKGSCSINGVHQPKLLENAPIYALSYINDRAVDLKFDGKAGYTLEEIKSVRKCFAPLQRTKKPRTLVIHRCVWIWRLFILFT